jgi:hypothetical protein
MLISIIKPARELAMTGPCLRVTGVKRQLQREGFEQVDEHLSGLATRRQLGLLLKAKRPPAWCRARR